MVNKQLVKNTLKQLKMAELRQLGQEYGVEGELTRVEIIKRLLYPLLLLGGGKAMEDLPEPALEKILKRLSQAEIRQLRIASPKFHERLKALEVKTPYFKELIAGRPQIGTRIIGRIADSLYSVAWSPDGSKLASGGNAKTIRIWDLASDPPIEKTLFGHTGIVYGVAWSPDGLKLASGSSDKTIIIWDLMSDPPIIWKTLMGHERAVSSVSWSPDGTQLASGSYDQTVRIWDLMSDPPIIWKTLMGHERAVSSVSWSPDGTQLASGSYDQTVRIWDSNTGRSSVELTAGDTVNSVAWSPDGSKIASGDDRVVRIWDSTTGSLIVEPLNYYPDPVSSVAWSSDGSRLAAGSFDGSISIWDIDQWIYDTIGMSSYKNRVYSIDWSPDGSQLAAVSVFQYGSGAIIKILTL